MATCEVCGNEYEAVFHITAADGSKHTFDSFECAITELAPTCGHCGCRVVGHGVEIGGEVYCCAHCARVAHGGRQADLLRDAVPA
jgi:hypothetical protein